MKDALTTDELELITAEIRKIKFADLQTVNLIAELRTAHKQITGTPLGIKEARDLIRHQAVNRDWLEGWVYLTHVDRFFNTKTKPPYPVKAGIAPLT